MAFDPTKPANGSLIVAAELRSQLTGLHDEIAAVPAVIGATVDGTSTASPGNPANASVNLTAGILHFSFEIPAGMTGEVSQAQLSNDLVNTQNAAVLTTLPQTSSNSNAVSLLGLGISDPPTQGEVQTIVSKIDELISALRR